MKEIPWCKSRQAEKTSILFAGKPCPVEPSPSNFRMVNIPSWEKKTQLHFNCATFECCHVWMKSSAKIKEPELRGHLPDDSLGVSAYHQRINDRSSRPEFLKCDSDTFGIGNVLIHTHWKSHKHWIPPPNIQKPQTPSSKSKKLLNSHLLTSWMNPRHVYAWDGIPVVMGKFGKFGIFVSWKGFTKGFTKRLWQRCWILEVGIGAPCFCLFTLLFFVMCLKKMNVACKFDWSRWSLGIHDAWMCSSIGTHFCSNCLVQTLSRYLTLQVLSKASYTLHVTGRVIFSTLAWVKERGSCENPRKANSRTSLELP